jgi:MOSC domain-containing protein YiiM
MLNEALPKQRVHSLNISGALRDVSFVGHIVKTGFFKNTVHGVVRVHRLGLEGDAQADLSVHGGPEKAVYFYPREHYADWEWILGSQPLAAGSFGENVTSGGFLETDLNIGAVLRIGTVTLQVLQPRSPCFKLQIRFGRPDMTALFFRHGKPGWYASVLEEGTFSAGDQITVLDRCPDGISVAEIWQYSVDKQVDSQTASRVMHLELLPNFWKERIGRR